MSGKIKILAKNSGKACLPLLFQSGFIRLMYVACNWFI